MSKKMKAQKSKVVFSEKEVAYIFVICVLFGMLIGCVMAILHYINELKACMGA